MNAKVVSTAAIAAASSAAPSTQPSNCAVALFAAANLLLADLERGVAIDARMLRAAMIASFGGSDAEGAWDWKTAYEACEAAQILFLRKFGSAMHDRAASPVRFLAMLTKLAALVPSHTRRSEESQALQQFSTPMGLGFVASAAAAITSTDLVLEPSAGTGLLAIHTEFSGARLVLNELADTRADLLDRLFPGVTVSQHDAAHIHDHLDAAVRPSVVLMNPPFSVAAHVDGRVADAALRHMSSALARLADGGRLVAITGANLSPDNPSWRDSFVRLQERGRLVFSAAIDGRVYARHGTTVETCLHVIDRVPTENPEAFPASPGMAGDTATLLDWVTHLVPSRTAMAASPAIARATLPGARKMPAARSFPSTRSHGSAATRTRKKNASVVFATQSLADIETSAIPAVIIESCPTRLFLPNERAIEPQIASIYHRFGLNDRQIEILARATPKRDYYCQSRRGNRLFELGLGEVALAFTAASSKTDQAVIADVLASYGRAGFAAGWLRHKGLDWAVELLEPAAAPDAAPTPEEAGS